MNEIVFALILVSRTPSLPDQEVAVFANRTQCMQEAQAVIQQGPSAYCVPKKADPTPEEVMRRMTTMMKTMMEQMNGYSNRLQ